MSSDYSMAGLESHLAQNIAEKHKVPCLPLLPCGAYLMENCFLSVDLLVGFLPLAYLCLMV